MPNIQPKHGKGWVGKLNQATSADGKSKYFYIKYYVHGKQICENTKMTDEQEAYDLLVKRRDEAARGEQLLSKKSILRYEDLREILLEDYRSNKKTMFVRKDGVELFPGRTRLDEFFKRMPVAQITTDKVREYTLWCRKQGTIDPTIRRELSVLHAAFGMAVREGKLLHAPYFPMPKDSEPAGQYIEPKTFDKLLGKMPEKIQPFFTFLYSTGCRIGAAMQIEWDMVSADGTEIKLPGAIVKSGSPLTIVLAGKGLEEVSGILRKMFRRDGVPVFDATNFRKVWYRACHAVKLGVYDEKTGCFEGARIHDLRASAAINLVDAGVPQDIVMKIGGWKSVHMFSRYNVINTDRIRAAMILRGEYVERMKQA